MSVTKNEIFEINITGMTSDGMGVGRIDGMAVFTPLTAPGDIAKIKIVKLEKNYAYGKLIEIVSPSADRAEADCPVYSQCGGCCYRHISYRAELKIKENKVKDALSRIGGFSSIHVIPIVGAGSFDGYRNKALLPLGKKANGSLSMGFYARHSHRIVDCEGCKLQPSEFGEIENAFRIWYNEYGDSIYDETNHTGKMRYLYLRKAEKTGEIMVCVVINGNSLKHEKELTEILRASVPKIKSILTNINMERTNVALGKTCRVIYGDGFIRDELCSLKFRLAPLSFYQVNHAQTETLYRIVGELAQLSGDECLLDLYCGIGTIGLTLAGKVRKLIGVETNPDAIESAKENAKENGISNAEFICEDAAAAASKLLENGEIPDVIVVDPPRKGLEPAMIETISKMGPKRLIYVSCDPATLARDLKLFSALGYVPNLAVPLDMFPRTQHVETIVNLFAV